tara:strand:+ start:76153 stop:77001 length:849 start_codon:yes stop_codon:yes gene_type:complete
MTSIDHLSESSSPSLDRLAVHSVTTKPWLLATAVRQYSRRGIRGISVWIEAIEGMKTADARKMIDDAGMSVPALVRGGFFCDASRQTRQRRIEQNRIWLQAAAEIEAEMLVLVVGAIPGLPLVEQRGWVRDAIEALLPEANALGIKLAIEPLHPMYAADKSCVNRIADARRMCESIDDSAVGVAVDVYHVWWDPDLESEIKLLGRAGKIFGFHICDWRTPTRDLLNDRALMGEGCIDIRGIRHLVQAAGFRGWNEVEIFSDELWAGDQSDFLDRIVESYSIC